MRPSKDSIACERDPVVEGITNFAVSGQIRQRGTEECRFMTLSLLPEPTWLLSLDPLSALITHIWLKVFRLLKSNLNTLIRGKGTYLAVASAVLLCSHQ